MRELRTFVTVVEEGRFSRAAQRLNLSQSAISQTVRGLEKHCGVLLLERTKNGVATTAAGKVLFAEARTVLVHYDQAMAAISAGCAEATLIRIGVPFGLPPSLLNGALATLAVRHPTTVVTVRQLSTGRQIDALADGEQDLGLLRHRPTNVDLDAALVADEPLGVLLSEDLATRLGSSEELSLESLVGLDWHGFARETSPFWYDELTSTLRSHGLHIESSASYTDELIPEVMMASVSSGRCFALVPAGFQAALSPPVTWRRLSGDPLHRRTWASWPAASRRRDLGHLVALLEDHLNRGTDDTLAASLGGDSLEPSGRTDRESA